MNKKNIIIAVLIIGIIATFFFLFSFYKWRSFSLLEKNEWCQQKLEKTHNCPRLKCNLYRGIAPGFGGALWDYCEAK